MLEEEYRVVRRCSVEYTFDNDSKGLEGFVLVPREGQSPLILGLCEGNHCLGRLPALFWHLCICSGFGVVATRENDSNGRIEIVVGCKLEHPAARKCAVSVGQGLGCYRVFVG